MNRFYTFIGFSLYQLLQFAIAVPIILLIIYTLAGLAPGGSLSERGVERFERPSFSAWLTGSGDNLGILNGDFGESMRTRQPVGEMINQRLPASLELLGIALVISAILGLLLAVVLVVLRRVFTDGILSIPLMLAGSIPVFCLAMLLILQFALRSQLFPLGGRCPPGVTDECGDFAVRVPYLILPVAALVIVYTAGIALYLRDAILRYARQEGTQLTLRHVVAGLLIFSPIGIFGTLAGMVSSQILIETMFGYPGVGRLVLEAATSRDMPVFTGILVVASVGVAIAFLIAMLLYGLMIAIFPPRPHVAADNLAASVEASPFRQRLRRLSTLTAWLAALVLVGITVMVLTAPGNATKQNLQDVNSPPTEAYPWGTDMLGRDYQTRVLQGGRVVLTHAATAGVVALVIGFILGVFAGLFSGAIGAVVNLPMNIALYVLQSFPVLLLLMFVSAIFIGTAAYNTTFIPVCIGLLTLPQTVPVVRTAIMTRRSGQTVPLLPVALYVLCLVMARAVLVGSMLDFLGLGTTPPTPSWGTELAAISNRLHTSDYLLTPPLALLTATIFCLTLIYVRLYDSFGFLVPAQTPKAKRGDNLFDDVNTENRDPLFGDVN